MSTPSRPWAASSRRALLYRVHPDGTRQLVRGAVFDELDNRSLRSDIVAAGDDAYVSNSLGAIPTDHHRAQPALRRHRRQTRHRRAAEAPLLRPSPSPRAIGRHFRTPPARRGAGSRYLALIAHTPQLIACSKKTCPPPPLTPGLTWKESPSSVQPHQVRLRARGSGIRHGCSADPACRRLVLALRIDAHPMPRRPGELNHLGGRIAARQVVLQLDRSAASRNAPICTHHLPAGSRSPPGGAYASTRTLAMPGR